MKLHENNLNPGLLTDSGFSKLNRCQANLQESDRTSVEPPVNGQPRLMAISGERTPGIERGLAYNSLHGRIESETYAGNPGSMNWYPDFNPAGFLHRGDPTEFRWRTSFLESCLVKAEWVLLYTEPIDKFSRSVVIEILLLSAAKRHRRRLSNLTSLICKTASMGYSIVKTSVRWKRTSGIGRRNHLLERWQTPISLNRLNHSLERWQKTFGLNRLNHSPIKLGLLCLAEGNLSNNSKLIVC
jgi:hypothetical protein